MEETKMALKNNEISAKVFEIRLDKIFPKIPDFVLTEVRPYYRYDDNKQKMDIVEGYKYTLIDMDSLFPFNVKVPGGTPLLNQTDIDESEGRIYVELPLEETLVRPYQVNYGKAKVTIIAPYITIATASDSEA